MVAAVASVVHYGPLHANGGEWHQSPIPPAPTSAKLVRMTSVVQTSAGKPAVRGDRVWIPAGTFLMGSDGPNHCRRYRPAARHAQAIDTSTSHVGFRCVRHDSGPTR
jgi:formylglycine-generating enzyme required for sulfatase activity